MILDGVKVEFGLLVDKTIAGDTITATSTSNQSDFSNVYDTIDTGEKQKIAYLEENYWLLDGSFVMPTDEDITGTGEIINIAPDPSFEDNAWQSETHAISPYTSRFNISVTKSTEHVLSGSYSQRINFSYSGGPRLGSSVYAQAWVSIKQSFSFQKGHKYYTRCYLFEENVESLQTGSKNYIGNVSSGSKNGENGKYISSIVNCANYAPTEMSIEKDVSFRTGYDIAEQYTIWFDDLLIVDLTEKYGAGNEPSIDVCDRIFNGKKNIVIGYESQNADRIHSVILEYNFRKKHESYGITLKFAPTSIVENFIISYYNGSVSLGQKVVTGNSNEIYKDKETRVNWDKVTITLSKIKNSYRQRARLQYVIFGTTDNYAEDELIEVSANKTLSLLADYSENGEFSFSFFNDGRYDIETIKDLSQRVFEELRIQAYVKKHLQSEYELWGTYYVESGKVEENGNIVSFTARDRLYRLDDGVYENGRVYTAGRSLADFARDVATAANVDIIISEKFENIISYGYIPEVPFREAFRLIAEAGNGIFGVDENDALHLWSYEEKIISAGSIDDTEIVKGSLSIENPNKIMGVKVTQYSFYKGDVAVEIGKVEGAILKATGEKMVVEFSDAPVDPDTVQVIAANGNVDNIQIFSEKILFTLSGQNGERGIVTITGIPYTVTESIIERGEKKNVKEIKENYLITSGISEEIISHQYTYSVGKYNYSAEILKDENIDVGNIVYIKNNSAVVTSVGFSLSYEDYSEEIQGVDR